MSFFIFNIDIHTKNNTQMKTKLFILAALLCASVFSAKAQTEKGKILLGGNVTFITQKGKSQITTKETSFSVGPVFGFFVGNNFAVGVALSYDYNKTAPIIYSATSSQSGIKHTSYGISPFARYYVNISEPFKFFAELAAGGSFGKSEFKDANGIISPDKPEYTSYHAAISPGLAFFPSKKIAVQLSIPLFSFIHQKAVSSAPQSNSSTFNAFSFAATTTPSIGVNFHF